MVDIEGRRCILSTEELISIFPRNYCLNKQDIFGRGKENGYNNKTGDIKEKQILDRQA